MASWWHRLIFIWNLLILGASFSLKSWVMLLVWKVIDINLWIWDIKDFPLDDLKTIFKAIPRGLCSLRYVILEDTGAGQVLNCPDVQKGHSFQVFFFFKSQKLLCFYIYLLEKTARSVLKFLLQSFFVFVIVVFSLYLSIWRIIGLNV